jgi:hypothetical protein
MRHLIRLNRLKSKGLLCFAEVLRLELQVDHLLVHLVVG